MWEPFLKGPKKEEQGSPGRETSVKAKIMLPILGRIGVVTFNFLVGTGMTRNNEAGATAPASSLVQLDCCSRVLILAVG